MKPYGRGYTIVIWLGLVLFTSIIPSEAGAKRPSIMGTPYFLSGETFSLTCKYKTAIDHVMKWTFLSNNTAKRVEFVPKTVRVRNAIQSTITIVNATAEDSGIYSCSCDNLTEPFNKTFLDGPILQLEKSSSQENVKEDGKTVVENVNYSTISLSISMLAYPREHIKTWFFRDGQNLSSSTFSSKYAVELDDADDITLKIKNLSVSDTATYTLEAVNTVGDRTLFANFSYDLRVMATPVFIIEPNVPIRKLINETEKLSCNITGYPLPKIIWEFVAEDGTKSQIAAEYTVPKSLYEEQSSIELLIQKSGTIICAEENETKTADEIAKATRAVYAYEIKNGFGIEDGVRWYPEHDNVTLQCLASKYDYRSVTWENEYDNVQNFETELSHVALLKIKNIPLSKSGFYKCVCVAFALEGKNNNETVFIQVEENRKPNITQPMETVEASKFQPVKLYCQADAVPPPSITWYKESVKISNADSGMELEERLNHTVLTSTLSIKSMKDDDQGKYVCVAKNRVDTAEKVVNLMLPAKGSSTVYIAIFCVVFITLMAIVVYLMLKVKREKQFRKELAAAGLLYFKEGALKSINPELNVDEQAELLPYDDRFEFPIENLILGKQLGAGAFGVVYKAEARGIFNAEESTTVAVKTVKKTADSMYIKALASELKIMVHLGKHVNIVNLLGACTKNIEKRELMVIVEYCRFGNIHNYLIKHREVFINQLTADNNEEKFGHENRAYSCSNDSGMRSNYGGSNQSHSTDQTFLNTANSGQSGRKASEGYVLQPEWRTNYESDYQSIAPRPLFSRDLLAWAFQIARGMEYLASRKVLHGDLAARNIVLADDNVVKICDFGLARSIYKNDEYKKKGDSLLPLKWLAVECLTDRIFSTQSDVWSFGIVLWEIFSLAKTPYPSYSDPSDLLKFLLDGNRLEKPKYANDKLYFVMQRCWEMKPTHRPSFTHLQEVLGNFLEETDRQRYIDLNTSYMEQNAENADREDLLAMMNSPDYNNLVTPSPFGFKTNPTFFNQTFFPPTPKEEPFTDENGYLRPEKIDTKHLKPEFQNHTLLFDSQLNKAPSNLSNHPSEVTPMLNLDNLRETGSQSDNEGGHSPFIDCPRIDEELDEVFDINEKNTNDAIDRTSGKAVANPTYITMDDIAVSPDKSHNGYVNSIPKVMVVYKDLNT